MLLRRLLVLLAFVLPISCIAEEFSSNPTLPVEKKLRRLDGVELSPNQVAQKIEKLMAAAKVTGLGVAVINKNEVVYQRAFGMADAERGKPLREDSVMYAASFTKAMFATLVMMLEKEGMIDLDKPIESLMPKPLPEYEKYSDLAGDERWKKITPRMLLSHTSGLPNWRWFEPGEKLRIYFTPGQRYAYSGEGINLLQFVLENGLKLDVGDLMQKRIFNHYGMQRTSMVWQPRYVDDMAIGHDEKGVALGHKQRGSARAAGSADASLIDMALFMRAMIRRDGMPKAQFNAMFSSQIRIRSHRQFPTMREETTTRDDAIQLSYGLGWGVFTSPYGKAFFKEGHDDGWQNFMVGFPGKKTAIVFMSNSSNAESIFKYLLSELIGDNTSPTEWDGYVPYDQKEK
ncbi:MAG: serine hydrolase domain-containing protein [Methylococcales bacterium]